MKKTEKYISSLLHLTPHEIEYREYTWRQIEKYINLSDEDLLIFKNQFIFEVDLLIEQARAAGKSPFALEQKRVEEQNKEIKRIRDIEVSGFSVGFDEFVKYIVPIIVKVDFFPNLFEKTFLGNSILEKVYQSTSQDYHESSEATGELLGFCDAMEVQGFSKTLRKNVEIILRSRALNYESVCAISHRNLCEVCKKLSDYISVESLWVTYSLHVPLFPHVMPADGEVRWCPGPHLLIAPNDPFGLR